jgi:hypothetical protein
MADGGIGEAALLSAAMGGATSAMSGRDPLEGALLGGLLGGVGGAFGGAGAMDAASLADAELGQAMTANSLTSSGVPAGLYGDAGTGNALLNNSGIQGLNQGVNIGGNQITNQAQLDALMAKGAPQFGPGVQTAGPFDFSGAQPPAPVSDLSSYSPDAMRQMNDIDQFSNATQPASEIPNAKRVSVDRPFLGGEVSPRPVPNAPDLSVWNQESSPITQSAGLANDVGTAKDYAGKSMGGSGIGDWWKGLSTMEKVGYGGLGAMGLQKLFSEKPSTVSAPKYSGPLSKFHYNKDAYTPLTTPQPTAYQPQYTNYRGYAEGGITALDAATKTVRENPPTDYQNYYTPNSSPSTAFESYYAPTEIPAQYDYLQNPNPPQYATPVLQDDSNYANQSARTTNPVQAPVTLSFPQDPVADSGGGAADSGGYSPGSPGDQGGFGAAAGGLTTTGGIASLGRYSDGGRMLKGPGDGMSDSIPARIGGKQEARLADGEFVVPADVVSHLGNGSTDAGARNLYKMMDKVRSARTGTRKQGRQISPNQYLPT